MANRDELFDILLFSKEEIEYLYKLVMTDYLSSDAGKMEDPENEILRLKLSLQKEKYEKLREWLELYKKWAEAGV